MSADSAIDYLGLRLAHPVVVGASPIGDQLDTARRCEDAGAAGLTLRSLFAEQIAAEQMAADRYLGGSDHLEAQSGYLPGTIDGKLGPDAWLDQIRRLRAALGIPVIASLNGTRNGPWVGYARLAEEAGAHAIELNLYVLPSNPDLNAAAVEHRLLEVVGAVRAQTRLPLSVKLSPFFSAPVAFVRALERVGANGVVLFNRFYQADIDVESLELVRVLHLSDPSELLLRLRWLALVSPTTKLSLACSGGAHAGLDVARAVMSGAHAVQVVSAVLARGPSALSAMIARYQRFLEEGEYESSTQLCGSMNRARCPDPEHWERADYAQLLQAWHGR